MSDVSNCNWKNICGSSKFITRSAPSSYKLANQPVKYSLPPRIIILLWTVSHKVGPQQLTAG